MLVPINHINPFYRCCVFLYSLWYIFKIVYTLLNVCQCLIALKCLRTIASQVLWLVGDSVTVERSVCVLRMSNKCSAYIYLSFRHIQVKKEKRRLNDQWMNETDTSPWSSGLKKKSCFNAKKASLVCVKTLLFNPAQLIWVEMRWDLDHW